MILKYKGISISYKVEGVGNDLVFLHGFLESLGMWDSIIEELKLKFRCISIDLLGHGKTDVLDEIHTMEMMADAVNSVLTEIEVRKALFIGHSMGGYVSLAYAERFPQILSGLCLMNSTALPDDEEKKKDRDRTVEVVKSEKRIFISMAISNLFASHNLMVYNEEINSIKEGAYKMSVLAITSALLGMKIRANRVNIFNNLKCKKLVILGKEDTILKIPYQKDYLKKSDSEIVVLDGGHMSHIENIYEISYIINQFIE